MFAFGFLTAAADLSDIGSDADYPAFARFVDRFSKTYSSELETIGRFQTFKTNLRKIEARNALGNEKHGITKFADLTPDEVRAPPSASQITATLISTSHSDPRESSAAQFRAKYTGLQPTTQSLRDHSH